jgi:hypothetical protein
MARTWLIRCTLLAILTATTGDAVAIEMFTYFGDGSRIGLPNLEVPIEAYPGIPLRSDRLRARRKAMRMGSSSAVRVGPGTPIGGGITIRSMPAIPAPTPEPIAPPPPAAEPATGAFKARQPARSQLQSKPTTGRPAAN